METEQIKDLASFKGEEGDWHNREIQSDTVPMFDSGTGRTYIIREFDFAIDPKVAKELREKKIKIDKQQLFNSHWGQIRALLWGDGLVANQDYPPKVIVGRKKYRIFILCEPKFRTIVNDKVNTLQEVFKK